MPSPLRIAAVAVIVLPVSSAAIGLPRPLVRPGLVVGCIAERPLAKAAGRFADDQFEAFTNPTTVTVAMAR
jgi:hypothetical protein